MKQCPHCRREGFGPKPFSAFNRNRTRLDGYANLCKEHRAKQQKAGKAIPSERRRTANRKYAESPRYIATAAAGRLRRVYGLSAAEYAEMFSAQNGRCGICGDLLVSVFDTSRKRPARRGGNNAVAHVDHCHTTGIVRGLLCSGCNVGLARFRDTDEFLLTAVRYLRASRATAQAISRAQMRSLQGEAGPHPRDPESSPRRGSRRDELSPFFFEE